jgi:hypothetical protein
MGDTPQGGRPARPMVPSATSCRLRKVTAVGRTIPATGRATCKRAVREQQRKRERRLRPCTLDAPLGAFATRRDYRQQRCRGPLRLRLLRQTHVATGSRQGALRSLRGYPQRPGRVHHSRRRPHAIRRRLHRRPEGRSVTISCDQCGSWIETTNLRHPGYCSARCRDVHRLQQQATSAARRRKPPRTGTGVA